MNLFSADDPDAALLGVVAPPLHALNNIAVGVNNHLSLGNRDEMDFFVEYLQNQGVLGESNPETIH